MDGFNHTVSISDGWQVVAVRRVRIFGYYEVLCVAERRFRTLNAAELLPSVHADAVFTDGKLVTEEIREEVA
jgi:hypothetical protein